IGTTLVADGLGFHVPRATSTPPWASRSWSRCSTCSPSGRSPPRSSSPTGTPRRGRPAPERPAGPPRTAPPRTDRGPAPPVPVLRRSTGTSMLGARKPYKGRRPVRAPGRTGIERAMSGAEQQGAPAGAGTDPDGVQRLWTPHRMAYIKGEDRPTGPAADDGCPFCRAPGLPDGEGLVVHRGDLADAVLNRDPYNSGHLLICPYRHVSGYTDLDEDETAEVARLTRQGIEAMQAAYRPQGYN